MKNYSKQREEIIEILKNLYNHPTAEEVYFLTKQKDPAVSRSTVYRNLGTLVQNGIVTQISISNGPDRYDYVIGRKNHAHIFCIKCNTLYDFDYSFMEQSIKENVFNQTGVNLFDDGILIKGICNSCKVLGK